MKNINEDGSNWNKNSIQFPRLLAELNGQTCGNCRDRVAKEMDITEDELQELFDRAEKEWQQIKEEVLPVIK